MRLFLESQNWSIHLTCSRQKNTTDLAGGTRQSGAYSDAPPSYTALPFPVGPVGKLYCSSSTRWQYSGSHLVSPNIKNQPLRARSFRKNIGRMFVHFRAQPNHRVRPQTYEAMSRELLSELPVDLETPELPAITNTGPWELPASEFSNTSPQRTVMINAQPQERVAHENDFGCENYAPPLQPGTQYPHQSYPSVDLSERIPLPQSIRTTVSDLALSGTSLVEDQDTNPYQSFIAITPTSTSTSTSSAVSPISPNDLEERAWTSNEKLHHHVWGFNSSSSYLVSPQHGCYPHRDEHQISVSPLSSRRSSTEGYKASCTSLPTPPYNIAITFSPPTAHHDSFGRLSPSLPLESNLASGFKNTRATSTNLSAQLNASAQHTQDTAQSFAWELNIGTPQTHRLCDYYRPFQDGNEDLSASFDEPPPSNSYETAPPLPVPAQEQQEPSTIIVPSTTLTAKKTKRSFPGDGCMKLFPPLGCGFCEKVFSGPYQKGNRNRHMNSFHFTTATDKDNKTCRFCDAVYKRADARRKHEWKKHKSPDCLPKKRRIEKKIEEEKKHSCRPSIPELH